MGLRVVLDTSVFAAGLAQQGPGSLKIINAWLANELELVTSESILAELRAVLRDVLKVAPEAISRWENRARRLATVVEPQETIADCRDPADNKVLEAAIAGKANYIVTFDDDLWKMSPYRDVAIMTVRDFLRKTGLSPRRLRR